MNTNRKCEVCYQSLETGLYFILSRTTGIVFLESPQVKDVQNKDVYTRSGEKIECDVIQGGLGYILGMESYPHLLCSPHCAQKISDSGREINHILQSEFAKGALQIDCTSQMTKCWDIFVIDSNQISLPETKCTNCGRSFPLCNPKHTTAKIKKVKTEKAVYGPQRLPFRYDTGHASTAKEKPNGTAWFYRLDKAQKQDFQFCCDACAVEYAEKYNQFIFFPNLIMRSVTGITPNIRQHNHELGNDTAWMRPYKMMPIP